MLTVHEHSVSGEIKIVFGSTCFGSVTNSNDCFQAKRVVYYVNVSGSTVTSAWCMSKEK